MRASLSWYWTVMAAVARTDIFARRDLESIFDIEDGCFEGPLQT